MKKERDGEWGTGFISVAAKLQTVKKMLL